MTERDINRRQRDKLWDVGEELAEIREQLPERKSERLQLRVTPTEKADVEFMTDLLGVSAADYLMHLHRRAMKDLERKNSRHDRGKGRGSGHTTRTDSDGPEGRGGTVRKPRRHEAGRQRRRGGDSDGGMAGVGAKL